MIATSIAAANNSQPRLIFICTFTRETKLSTVAGK
jgi:hypothetical protein